MTKKNLSTFLKKYSIDKNNIYELDNDASNRRYFRTEDKIIAYIPQSKGESIDDFIKTTKLLKKINIKVPTIHIIDKKLEFLMLEDFGDKKISRIKNKNNILYLLRKSIDLLIQIQSYKPDNSIQEFSSDEIVDETIMFVDWFMKKEKKIKINQRARNDFINIILEIINYEQLKNTVYIHRDYHVDNIFYFRDKKDEIGIIDYQDLRIGHVSYDLLSILQDTRNPIKIDEEETLIRYFCKKTDIDYDSFSRGYDFFSIQRNLKIIGIFSRLKHRDKKNKYMNLIQNCINYIKRRLKKTKYQKLNSWLKENYEEF